MACPRTNTRIAAGVGLIEVLIGLLVGLVVVGGAVTLMQNSVVLNDQIRNRSEMQQNLRVALRQIGRDLGVAGSGTPDGGIQLPGGNGSLPPRFACDGSGCYLSGNNFLNNRLFQVNPGNARGPTISDGPSDVLVMMYRDYRMPLDVVSVDTAQLEVGPNQDPPLADPKLGLQQGDVLGICDGVSSGCAAVVVTGYSGNLVYFNDGDPLRFNQSGAEYGNVAALKDAAGQIPAPFAYRLIIVTYFVEGATNLLMRQVNAHPPVALAEDVDDLQFTFDIFDTGAGTPTAALDDANLAPNQIRKVNVDLHVRARERALLRQRRDRMGMTTSVSIRNAAFQERHKGESASP